MIPEGAVRAVLDTNVLVSAFIRPKGISARIRRAGEEGRFTLVLSEVLHEELRDVLARPRIQKAGRYSPEEAAEFLDLLEVIAEIVPGPLAAEPVVQADPDDDWVLATAVEGAADVIVSGDKGLLDIGSHKGIPILTPSAFLEELKGRS